MQYSRIFGPGRLSKAILVSVALCLATISSADAARRKHRHVRAVAVERSVDAGITASSRYAAFVVDDKTGRVLYARNQDELRHPASLTKMMTLFLLFEELDKRRLSMSSRLEVSAKAAAQSPSKLGLRPGQTIAVEDAILALVTKSANDVAVTVAENIGGSEEAFARRMTSTARRIGMKRTTFYNASGLPNASQFTTARDMVTLGRALQERFPTYYRFFSTRSFAWGNAVHGNHNKLLYRLEGIDGIKTGYTEASGFNLVSSLNRDGRHLVAAVLGGSSGRQRDDHMAALLSQYLASASTGAKMSTVLRSGKSADAGDEAEASDEAPTDVADVEEAPAKPTPPAKPVVETVALASEPLMLVAPSNEGREPPVAPHRPRIARSDIVPLDRSTGETRTSSDHGAAVAMARAILLPQSSRPMPAAPEAPVRTAAVASRSAEPAAAPPSMATATLSNVDIAALTTSSIPRRKADAAPAPAPTAAARNGWLVQIGAFDGEGAARGALAAARDKVGGALAGTEGFTETIGGGSSRLWRARFAGFKDQSAADDACKALKRKNITCLALRQ